MGNRATVVFTDGKNEFSPAVYLHWNGGPESIHAFLAELDRREVRADQNYEAARFIAIVAEFFDRDQYGGLSLGVSNGPKSDSLEDLFVIQTDLGDNGIYLINRTSGQPVIRRFVEDWGAKRMRELTPDEIDEEMDPSAMADYARNIASVFTKEVGR